MATTNTYEYDDPSRVPMTAADHATGTLHDEPTQSHALAVADHDDYGAAGEYHDEPEIRDLGWHEEPGHVARPLVHGLSNEELWMYVRRFNKQVFHVKEIPHAPPGGLDLNVSKDEEFSSDKLRANLERLYMTVAIGMLGAVTHVARLRSWRETRRTAAFCAAYFTAWMLNLLAPLFFSTILALIVYPPSRSFLFPPAPLALVDRSTGGVQKPRAGMLGTHDTLTGAPERHKGEAAEQEAHNFVSSIGSIGLGAMVGKSQKNQPEEHTSRLETSIPEPTNLGLRTSNSSQYTGGTVVASKHDKTKQPMEVAAWEKARPVMRIVSNTADTWERFANALSPTHPFDTTARLRLGGIIGGGLAVSFLLNPVVLVKSITFISGAIFFSDPLIIRFYHWLNRTYPNWLEYLDPRNHILLGVPTNAQLTLTLLRLGEANRAPLPPPPRSGQPPPDHPDALHADDIPLDASNEEVQGAIHLEPGQSAGENDDAPEEVSKKQKHGRKLVGFMKHATRAGVNAVLGTDRLKAQAGNEHAKMRLGVLPSEAEIESSGPVDFVARHHGKKGHLYLSTAATPPRIAYSAESSWAKAQARPLAFAVDVPDIVELKKFGGLGWKSKLIVGWALERELADGLDIVDNTGQRHTLTAIPLRDELFNRLVAIGAQKWETF